MSVLDVVLFEIYLRARVPKGIQIQHGLTKLLQRINKTMQFFPHMRVD